MAGGIFSTTNKTLPGAYINVKSAQQSVLGAEGTSGVVFTFESGLGWGSNGVIEVSATSDFLALFGKPISDTALTGLRQILANARTAFVYNVNDGTPAVGTSAVLPWTFNAAHNGTAGNDINVTVQSDVNVVGKYSVITTYNSNVVDKQSVTKASQLVANEFVVPVVTSEALADDGVAMLSALSSPVSIQLAGGVTNTPSDSIDAMQTAIEAYEYNTIVAADSSDSSTIHSMIATSVQRLRDEQGREVQSVVPVTAGVDADYEGIIVVGNTVKMEDGTVLTQSQFAGFIAGATSAAGDNQSLTYATIQGAVDAVPRFTDDQAIAEIKEGHLIARATRGFVRIEVDVNSLITFTSEKSSDLSKNRVVRVLDTFRNWVRITWEDNFVGKINNDATGRDLLKATIANYLTTAQARGAIQDFKVEDITVTAGPTSDSVIVNVAITPTDAMEKLYMYVQVN